MEVDNLGLGRWAYVWLSRKYKRNFWLIAGYKVCQETNTGTLMAYSQQVRILHKQSIEHPKPREQWNKNIKKLLLQIPKGNKILIIAEFNGQVIDNDIGNLMAEIPLYNLMTAKHGSTTPATYIRGIRTVDHVLGTKGVLKAIENIGLIKFHKHLQSDHRGMFIDLYQCNIFSGILYPLQYQEAQKVQLRAKNRVTKYLTRTTEAL
eukprot:12099925-Ditylum_brightwellii.AAC.1